MPASLFCDGLADLLLSMQKKSRGQGGQNITQIMNDEARNKLALLSKRKSLKSGDRVVLTGILRVDTLAFSTGETQTINRLALTQVPHMLVREKRVSTTVYEQRKKLR